LHLPGRKETYEKYNTICGYSAKINLVDDVAAIIKGDIAA
jgi:hypothetical protein